MTIDFSNHNKGEGLGSLFSVDRMNGGPIPMTRLFTKFVMKYAACTTTSSTNNPDWVKPFHLRLVNPHKENFCSYAGIAAHEECYFDEETALKICVFADENEVIFAFAALGSAATQVPEYRRGEMTHKQFVGMIDNVFFEKVPPMYTKALQAIQNLIRSRAINGRKISLCAHSLGGSISEYVGLHLRIPTYNFNAVLLGKGLLDDVPRKNLNESDRFINNISAENDYASDFIESSILYQYLAESNNLPKHSGRKYLMPTNYSMWDRHGHVMGNLLQLLGYSDWTNVADIQSHDFLPEVLSYKKLKNVMHGICRALESLARASECVDRNKLLAELGIIKEGCPNLYGFLCFSVWLGLGKRDYGESGWGEKALLQNPELLHLILTHDGKKLTSELMRYFEFLGCIFQLISTAKEAVDLSSAAELLPDCMKAFGYKDFQIEARDLPRFLFKLRLFLSDQLRNGLTEKMKKAMEPQSKRSYSLVPKKHLLATRFKVSGLIKRILIVSVECSGVLKQGGLAEAVSGMASGLSEMGHEVILIMPKFEKFPNDDEKGTALNSLRPTDIVIEHSFNGPRKDQVYVGSVKDINTLFIENTPLVEDEPNLFELGSGGIYKMAGDDEHATKLKERFVYFGSAVAAFVHQMQQNFDVVLFNDWHGALAIHLIVKRYFQAWLQGNIPAMVYVSHNNGYAAQGGLDRYHSKKIFESIETNKDYINVAKECLRFADHFCTVSPTYAEEIQAREANGLDKEMRKAASSGKLTGIVNGANPNAFNPMTDPMLANWVDPVTKSPSPLNYGFKNDLIEKKAEIKVQVQKWLNTYYPGLVKSYGVDVTRDKVILFVGRLDSSQKGLEKFKQAMYAAKQEGATFIVMGSLEPNDILAVRLISELKMEAVDLKGPDWGGALILEDVIGSGRSYQNGDGTIPGISSLIRSIATFGFFPSKYEPCGLVQFETWLFGGLVIASGVGGLSDTVSVDETQDGFNGFNFRRCDAWDSWEQDVQIKDTVVKALQYWDSLPSEGKNALMSQMIKRARLSSWTTSSNPEKLSPIEQYERVLERAVRVSKTRLFAKPVKFNAGL